MKQEEAAILHNIQLIEKNQGLLMEQPKSAQQQILHLYGQRHLLSTKMMHRQLDKTLSYLPGTFSQRALYSKYIQICIEHKVQLDPEDHPLIKELIQFAERLPTLRQQAKISIMDVAAGSRTVMGLSSFEQYISFLNFISSDLIKLIRKGKTVQEQSDRISLDNVDPKDLIQFLIGSIPKVLFNVILNKDVLPPQFREQDSMEVLFRATDLQFFAKSHAFYGTLMKILVKMLIRLDLSQQLQKSMMEVVFRYFYCFNHDKKYSCTDVFIDAYHSLHETVKMAMSDEFALFLRILRKIGKDRFCDFLLEKHPALKQVSQKLGTGNYVGYAKENLFPFPSIRVYETITIPNGKIQTRTFEVLQDYSLFYFNVQIPNYDITLRLYYLGDFDASKTAKVQLINYEKKKENLRTCVMAVKKGLYQFQFDNTYSWMNKKVILFERIALTPLQFLSVSTPPWINGIYQNIPLNEMSEEKKFRIQNNPVRTVPAAVVPAVGQNIARITKEGPFYRIVLSKKGNLYEFQTESEDRVVHKFKEIESSADQFQWFIGQQPLENGQTLGQILKRPDQKDQQQNQEKDTKKATEEKAVPFRAEQSSRAELQERQQKINQA